MGADEPSQTGEANAERLRRVAKADRVAFRKLYDETSAGLLGVCVRILGDRGEAEEALQETFISIWRKAGTFETSRGSAGAWMATLARHCAIDRLRARSRIAAAPLDLADDVPDSSMPAAEAAEGKQERARLETCLDLLASDDATLIRTAFFQGATYSELAARSERPLATIKSRVRRALLKLAECLR